MMYLTNWDLINVLTKLHPPPKENYTFFLSSIHLCISQVKSKHIITSSEENKLLNGTNIVVLNILYKCATSIHTWSYIVERKKDDTYVDILVFQWQIDLGYTRCRLIVPLSFPGCIKLIVLFHFWNIINRK